MLASGSVMRVAACTAGGGTVIETREAPAPGAGEMLLALRCCGLCGTDLFKLDHATEPAGTVLGHELVGTVVEVGDGVDRYHPGERVVVPHHVACGRCSLCRRGSDTLCPEFRTNLLAPGGFSELVLVRERAVDEAVWVVPPEIDDATAVFLEPAACVLRGVDKAALPAGEGCAMVLGAGSMGLLHLLLLRSVWRGGRVVVCDPIAERRATARRLGAAAVCSGDRDELVAAARETSGGVGADAVFDTVGGSGPLVSALAAVRPGGVVVLFAHAGEGEVAGFELNPFFKNEKRVVATYSGGLAEQRRIAGLMTAGTFDPSPLVSHRLALSQIAAAVELARAQQALKILLVPDKRTRCTMPKAGDEATAAPAPDAADG